ncbi:MAG: hypothetical protein KKH74_01810 [Gammaproteobacteria bacterium]|nr:hypothetical protein [Gammaproteobacteria bacterium]MBU1731021.1 hypothetical protein [Gammaproteobacteria bacterium]MBU1893681.1 hypothetical protein [Gammaproteobacteria bacterium]
MPITPLPTPPTRSDPASFAARGDAFLAALPTFQAEANALETNVNAKELSAVSAAVTAIAKASEAAASAVDATNNGAAQVVLAAEQVALATGRADAAAASAVTAITAPGTSATSTTSLSIAIDVKALTIQPGKALVVGMSVKIAATASPTNWMFGDVTAYDSGTGALTVNVTVIQGAGTFAAWTVSLSAPGLAPSAAAAVFNYQNFGGF